MLKYEFKTGGLGGWVKCDGMMAVPESVAVATTHAINSRREISSGHLRSPLRPSPGAPNLTASCRPLIFGRTYSAWGKPTTLPSRQRLPIRVAIACALPAMTHLVFRFGSNVSTILAANNGRPEPLGGIDKASFPRCRPKVVFPRAVGRPGRLRLAFDAHTRPNPSRCPGM